jgi:hypothetical protein
MPVAAAVQFTQGVTVGPPGEALFGVTGTNVTVANGNNALVDNWAFDVIDVPPGSAIPIGLAQDGATPTWTFDPDVTGGYLIQITLTGSDGSVAIDTRCFGVKETNGRFRPPFKATDVMLNFAGQTRGWATYMEAWFDAIDSGAGSGVTAVTGSSPIASSGGTTPNITLSVSGQAQGDILYYNGTNWVRLPAGTLGQFLETQGGAANPLWATPSASVDIGSALAATHVEYWSGSLGQFSGEYPGANCFLNIAHVNAGVNQDGTTILGSSARGYGYTSSAGPTWIGSYKIATPGTGWALRGNAAGIGGFTLITRFGIDMITTTPTIWAFVGMMDATQLTSAPSFDWTTQTSIQAVGAAISEVVSGGAFATNWKIVSCDGGATTSTDSGLPIIVNDLYELTLVAAPDASSITWTLKDLTAATSATGSITTHLPAKTMPLGWQSGMQIHSGGGGSPGNVWSTVRYMLESNF